MKIDIEHLAKLSRLKIDESQHDAYEKCMKDIITMVEQLPPITGEDKFIDPSNPMICREDVVTNNFKRDDILANAPQMQAGCVVVPKVIE